MKHRPETQASGVYDANADTQLVKAAYDYNLAFASKFVASELPISSGAGSSGVGSGGD